MRRESSMQDFKKLKVWQAAHRPTLDVYRAPRSYPREELIAAGSSNELEYQLILGRGLGHLPSPDFVRLIAQLMEVRRMLASLIARVVETNAEGSGDLGAD